MSLNVFVLPFHGVLDGVLLVLHCFDFPCPLQALGHAQVVDVKPTLKHELILLDQTLSPSVSSRSFAFILIVDRVTFVLVAEFSLEVNIEAPLSGCLNYLVLEFLKAVDLVGLEPEEHWRLEGWLHQRLPLVGDYP